MTKKRTRDRAKALGMTIGKLARQPMVTRKYGVKDKAPKPKAVKR